MHPHPLALALLTLLSSTAAAYKRHTYKDYNFYTRVTTANPGTNNHNLQVRPYANGAGSYHVGAIDNDGSEVLGGRLTKGVLSGQRLNAIGDPVATGLTAFLGPATAYGTGRGRYTYQELRFANTTANTAAAGADDGFYLSAADAIYGFALGHDSPGAGGFVLCEANDAFGAFWQVFFRDGYRYPGAQQPGCEEAGLMTTIAPTFLECE